MIENRKILVLYISATCNLKCTYCYIDKSPALMQIDKILEESFSDNYYFNFAKEIFPDPKQLLEIQLWGGEPSIGLHRLYDLMPSFINYYPNLYKFMMSTNFTPENWFDEFYGFMKILGQFPNRKFTFLLQLSIDGPEYINDKNRGNGVTKRFFEQYNKLLKTIDKNLPKNVCLEIVFKPTLTSDIIAILQTKEQIIEYFQLFDNFIQQARRVKEANVVCYEPIPNTAVPSPHTKQDGINFANYCRLTKEIERENDKEHYFKIYKEITSFIPRHPYECKYKGSVGTCGSGRQVVGLLPDRRISACHNGFVELLEEYKKNCDLNKNWDKRTILNNLFTNNKDVHQMCMTIEEYEKYEKMVDCYYKPDCTFQILNLTTLIRVLARMGQIDEKYLNEEEAVAAANYLLLSTSYCIRDNIGVTGSMILQPMGLIKLLLNGAREYIEEDLSR